MRSPVISIEPLIIRVGISSVSDEGARENLNAEIKDFDFDKISVNAKESWNKELSCMNIEGTEKQKTIFYTGLYHMFIQPNNIADVSGNYLSTDNSLKTAVDKKHYSTFSLWDTYRAAHPLYTLVQEERTAGFINSMLRQYESYGYLPIWQLWGTYHKYCHALPSVKGYPPLSPYARGLKGTSHSSLLFFALKKPIFLSNSFL